MFKRHIIFLYNMIMAKCKYNHKRHENLRIYNMGYLIAAIII